MAFYPPLAGRSGYRAVTKSGLPGVRAGHALALRFSNGSAEGMV